MTVGGMGFMPERLLMMMMIGIDITSDNFIEIKYMIMPYYRTTPAAPLPLNTLNFF